MEENDVQGKSYEERIQDILKEFESDVPKMLAHIILIQMVTSERERIHSQALGNILETLMRLTLRLEEINTKVEQMHSLYSLGVDDGKRH